MSFNLNQTTVDFLGLKIREIKVLECIKTHPECQISEMAKNIGIPRMTIYSSLKTLKKRGFIHYKVKGRRKLWHTVAGTKLQEILKNIASVLS